ncbi:MAG: hypothetical protein FWF82_06515 [Oscillospiraceae bacterium]|nr:hypothetical protein [Oscillospiraceae bacterium]
MKKATTILAVITAAAMTLTMFAGCDSDDSGTGGDSSTTTAGNSTTSGESATATDESVTSDLDDDMVIGTVYAVMSTGVGIKEQDFGYDADSDNDEIIDKIAQSLEEWTYLNFTSFDCSVDEDGKSVTIDWDGDSAFVTGEAPEEQHDNFHMYDAQSLRWFVLNSMCLSIIENIGEYDVYFLANGAKISTFEGFEGFDTETAYNKNSHEYVILV